VETTSHTLRLRRRHELAIYAAIGALCVLIGAYLALSNRAIFTIGSLAVLSFLFYLLVRRVAELDDRSFVYLIVAALIVRIIIAIALHGSSIVQEADALIYHSEASRLSLALLGTGSLRLAAAGNAFGYVYFSSFIYAGLGANALFLELINCFVGVACGVYVYIIALGIWRDRRQALVAAALALFIPGILVWSTMNLKDSWVSLFVLIAIWKLIQIRERGLRSSDLIIVAICIVALWTIRFYMTLIIAPLALYAIGAGRRRSLVYLAVLLLVILLIFNYALIGRNIMGVNIGLEEASSRLLGLASGGGSTTGVSQDISSPARALAFMPKGIALLLFSPFPWNAPTSTIYAFAIPEMIVVYLLWIFIIIGMIRALKKRPKGIDIVILYVVSTTALYSLLAGNIGTFYRVRTPIMLLLFVFAAGGLLKTRESAAEAKLCDDPVDELSLPAECSG
jgi:hypothetical protein